MSMSFIFISLFIGIPIIIGLILISIGSFNPKKKSCSAIGFILITLSCLAILFIKENTIIEDIPDSNWKQIYTNNEDAKIELQFNYLYPEKNIINTKDDVINKSLIDKLKKFNYEGKILATKNENLSETRKFKLDKSNIVLEDNIDDSDKFKITKIEYRKVKSKKLNFKMIEYEENNKVDYDGEIRIIISPIKKDESLIKLFGEGE